MMTHCLLAFGPFGGWEIALIALLGLLIFGGRLPQVARNMGKGIVEFKKGLKGIEDDIDKSSDKSKRLDDQPAAKSASAEDHTSERV